jgi:hypothetical protein
MIRIVLAFLLGTLALAAPPLRSQPPSANLPTFEAATIKAPDPAARRRPIGFYGSPRGACLFWRIHKHAG